MRLKGIVLLAGSMGLLAGCTNYYQVRDPQSGSIYYTRMVGDHIGGAVSFHDERTNQDVTLQQSEVAKIDRGIYKNKAARPDLDQTVHPSGSSDIRVKPDQDVHINVDKGSDTRIRVEP